MEEDQAKAIADQAEAVGMPRRWPSFVLWTLAFVAVANLLVTCIRMASTGTAGVSAVRVAVEIASAALLPTLAFMQLVRSAGQQTLAPGPQLESDSTGGGPGREGAGPATSPRRWLRRARWVLTPVLLVVAFVSISGQWDTVTDAVGQLAHLHWRYVKLAVYAEALSTVAFALLGWILLRARGARLTVHTLIALSLASNALTVSMPAGQAVAATFSFDQLRRRGVTRGTATRVLILTVLIAAAALALLVAVGVALAGGHGPAAPFRIVVAAVLAVLALVAAALIVTRRARWPRSALAPGALLAALGAALGNWITDCGCLVAAILAVGGHVPWSGLLVVYGVGQIAANVPITPGGVGVVEGTLSVLLVAYGMHGTTAVAAVLLYRIVSFWVQVPIGLAIGATMHLRLRRRATRIAAPRGEVVPLPVAEQRLPDPLELPPAYARPSRAVGASRTAG